MFKNTILFFFSIFSFVNIVFAQKMISEETQICLSCHEVVTPGIVKDWKASLHSQTTLKEALNKKPLFRKVNADLNLVKNGEKVIGCAECHTLNSQSHKDTFNHNGLKFIS